MHVQNWFHKFLFVGFYADTSKFCVVQKCIKRALKFTQDIPWDGWNAHAKRTAKIGVSSSFSTAGFPISYYLSWWKRIKACCIKTGLKIGKGNSPKVNETQGFLSLGHSRWTTCGLLNWFCPIKCPPFCHASHNKPFLYYGEAAGAENWNGNSKKINETQGFMTLGHSNWTIWNLFS